MQLTHQEMVRLGMGLRPAFRTDAFQKSVEILRYQYQTNIMATDPHEREKREAFYYEARALEALLSTLQTIVHIAESDTDDDNEI